MKKFLLPLSFFAAFNFASAQTTILSADFTGQTLPAGWTNDSLGQAATMLWQFNNPGFRSITGANFDADFAILDSDNYGSSRSQNASLTTPSFSTIGYAGDSLIFSELFRSYAESHHAIYYSINGGSSWTPLRIDSADIGYPDSALITSIALPAGAINQANVKIKFTYVGNYGYYWALDNIMVKGYANCSGTPTAGTIQNCPASVCPNIPYTLTLSGASTGLGISYQWMSSTNGTTYSAVAGATGLTLTDSISAAPKYYKVVVSCSGGSSASTAVVSILNLTPTSGCYCLPVHPACFSGDFITDVSITATTLNNTNSMCTDAANGAYSAYPAAGNTTASLAQNQAYTFNVTTNGDHIISVWIDFNQNGVFDITEWKQVCLTSLSAVPNSVSMTIPSGAVLGQTGMRIRARASGSLNDSTSACTEFFSGECEDYIVTITLPLGIDENLKTDFTLFPNPAQEFLTISTIKNNGGAAYISITDLPGNKVMNDVKTTDPNYLLNISNLPNGIYLVSVGNQYGVTVKKLIVAR